MTAPRKPGFTVPERLKVWTWIEQGISPETIVSRVNQRRKSEKMKKYNLPAITQSDVCNLTGFYRSAHVI